MGHFDNDFERADDALAEAFGTLVSLCRGNGQVTENVPAEVYHFDESQEADEDTSPEVVEQRGFIIRVDNYKIRGQVMRPKEGDFITQVVNGETLKFQVLPQGQRPAVQHFDENRTRWLVRTKLS